MREPSPAEKKMWRDALHVQMHMILRCLENGEPVPHGLRKRTYNEEYRQFFEDKRGEYANHIDTLPSPKRKAPDYACHYVERVQSHARALEAVRLELKRFNRRVDLDDSQKRQKRPAIIRRYAELRREFSAWLKQWEAQADYYADAELYFRKPEPGEWDYRRGKQYRWYYRFISTTEYNRVPSVGDYAVSAEIAVLRSYLARDAE